MDAILLDLALPFVLAKSDVVGLCCEDVTVMPSVLIDDPFGFVDTPISDLKMSFALKYKL